MRRGNACGGSRTSTGRNLIEALIRIDAQLQARARKGRRAKLSSTDRLRSDEARGEVNRLGRIIYFLRFRSPASSSTERDDRLRAMLAEKYKAKGQWEHNIES